MSPSVAQRTAAYTSESAIDDEHTYAANNYHPLPVVLSRGEGPLVYDPEGNEYLDFLSAYSAVNQGHCHPKIIDALTNQASRLTLSSRAFYNDIFPQFAKFVTEFFGYESVLPMNTGAEAVETAIKMARRWGYMKKGIPANQAIVLSCANNFHGRTMGIVSMSTDPDCKTGFGPFLPSVGPACPASKAIIRYGNIDDLELAFKTHGDRIAGFLVEPIQGEAGVVVPPADYLPKVRELCTKYNVLFIADEIQTGIARTGKMLCVEHSNVKPDAVLLGKAISGGVYPVSVVLSSADIMSCFEPGSHGSTYGGNPLGSAVAMAALEVVREEGMVEQAERLGQVFRKGIQDLQSPLVELVRGKGLLNAIVIDESKTNGKTAWDLCLLLKARGLLAKPTHGNIVRLSPPLCITDAQLESGIAIIGKALADLPSIEIEALPVKDAVSEAHKTLPVEN